MKIKLFFTVFFVAMICTALGGCMSTNRASKDDATEYIQDKYNSEFKCVRENNQAWNADFKNFKFYDANNNEFDVRYNNQDGKLYDNYQSIKYDAVLSNKCVSLFNDNYKCIINTRENMLDKDKNYSSSDDYLHACRANLIYVYTTDSIDKEYFATCLKNNYKDVSFTG